MSIDVKLENGVRVELRGGDCLKNSLSKLINIDVELIPNFHLFPKKTWKFAFESWVKSQGYSFTETDRPVVARCISIFRLKCKVTGEFYPLHAVVTNNGEIEFDILAGKNESLEYAYFVRAYLINKN